MAEVDNQRGGPHGFGAPDPSLATKEEIAQGRAQLEELIKRNREETKGWIESLQILLESKIISLDRMAGDSKHLLEEKIASAEDKTTNLDRVVQTRLAGSETALNAAMAASDKVVQEIKLNFGAVINEMRAGITKQIENLDRTINDLKERVTESCGQSKGTNQMIAWLIAGLSALAAAASFIMIAMSRSSGG